MNRLWNDFTDSVQVVHMTFPGPRSSHDKMYLSRWTLIFVIVIKKFAAGSSIAEEINFEVSNMKELTKNDPQVYMLEKIMESQLDQTYADETDEFDASPSEIVETRVPIGETEPEDVAAQVKRPRRRRRRRRRKRPKPTVNNEDVETYYTLPEEEVRHKPIKTRPQNIEELLPESSNEPPRRRNVKRRRRPIKRPMMDNYFLIAEANADNWNKTDELQLENRNHDQVAGDKSKKVEYEDRTDSSSVKISKVETEHQKLSLDLVRNAPKRDDAAYEAAPLNESLETRTFKGKVPSKTSDIAHYSRENEFETRHKDIEFPMVHPSLPDAKKPENLHSSLVAKRTENQNELKLVGEQVTNARTRKRPSQKENTKLELEPETEASDPKSQVKNTHKGNSKTDGDENANKIVHKTKSDDRLKNNDTKKEVFKLRRLPPISAILRQAKMRPKNESFLKPPFKVETFKIRENVGNEILTNVSINEVQRLAQNETKEQKLTESSIPVVDDRKSQQPVTEDEKGGAKNDDDSFEFPIITYTEQRQKHTATSETNNEPEHLTTFNSQAEYKQKSSAHASTPRVEQKPTSTATTVSSTTENTAFIYVPCNQTIAELLKGTSNGTVDNITASTSINVLQDRSNTGLLDYGSVRPVNKTIRNETANILDAAALNELEKLLQSELESMDSTSTEKGTKDSLVNEKIATPLFPLGDVRPLESELEYLYQNKATSLPKFTKDSQDTKFWSEYNRRQPKRLQESSKYKPEAKEDGTPVPKLNLGSGYGKDIILSYTSTSSSALFNDIDSQELLHENELSLHLKNNSFHRRLTPDSVMHKSKNHSERKKLPLAVKSAIIISGAILALAVLGFFALLLSCKIRHAKSRMKCHRELYREQFQNSEFRQSSRSTSPVVSKSNYNGRNFSNNIQSNVASNRNYYLWQTLRKTFQYD